MSKINSRGVGSRHRFAPSWRMMLFLLCAIFALSLSSLTTSNTASAAPTAAEAQDFCGKSFKASATGSNEANRNACINGYLNGNGQGQLCSGNYSDRMSFDGVTQRQACIDGYNQKVSVENARGNANGGDTPAPAPNNGGDTPAPAPSNGGDTPAESESGPTPVDEATAEEEEGETCAVEKIGWILCPIIEGTATMADKLFHFLADTFLEVEPELLTSNPEGGKGTISAWNQARNLANIMFVIAFIFIIYSQITGAGLNNYGIKRMLPRLIIAAIAVNVSYYICQAMVDLSNLLGYGIMQALQDISNGIGPSVMGGSGQGTNTQTSDGWLAKIAIGALAVAGLVWLLLAPLAGIVSLVLVTCLVIVIVLLLRKAFIVLLVVVSPIAFVMYLLPNTEKYFSKWLNMFWQLLMVFPVVALLLGGGQLASTIILVSGSQDIPPGGIVCEDPNDNTPVADPAAPPDPNAEPTRNADDSSRIRADTYGVEGECGEEIMVPGQNGAPPTAKQANWTLGLVAAGVAVAPLLAVWAVLKGALSAAGAIGGKISGAVQKGAGGVGGLAGKGLGAGEKALKKRMGESTQAAWQRSQARGMASEGGRFDRLAGGYGRRKARRSSRLGSSKEELERALSIESARNIDTRGLTDAGAERARARAAGTEATAEEQEVKNRQALTQSYLRNSYGTPDTAGNISNEDKLGHLLEEAIVNGDQAGVRAATNMLMGMGGPGKNQIRDRMATHGTSASAGAVAFRQHITESHDGLKASDADVYAAASDGSAAGLAAHSNSVNTYRGLTDDQLASQSTRSHTSGTGASSAIGEMVTIVDAKGKARTVTRGRSILASKAGTDIKGVNRGYYG